MKLTYWKADCLTDSDCYSIRTRTRREALEALHSEGLVKAYGGFAKRESVEAAHERGVEVDYWELRYGPLRKVTVEYESGFDLMEMCMSEGRGFWEV